jgi:hypothetical protein
MPKAINTNTTTAASLDAELIAVCNRYIEIENYFKSRYGEEDIDGDDLAIWEEVELLDRAANLRATTFLGHTARAKMLSRYLPALIETRDCDGPDDKLIAALLRDMTGEAGA